MEFGPSLASVQKDMNLIEIKKVVLVTIKNTTDELYYYKLSELKSLCEACNYEIVESVYQNLDRPNTRTYVGSGKIQEIKTICEMNEIDTIVFGNELSPVQIKNIEEILDGVDVIDRTMLILQIFSKRATSKIGKLQVEIAEAKYMLPRLIGKRSYMSRITSGAAGTYASRGSGETQLELDKRHLKNKITQLSKELEYCKLQRQTTRKLRNQNDSKSIAFVGYTNAGKSSTINSLLSLYGVDKKELFVKDMLFATLETQTRLIKLPNNHEFLITDTVGFVSDLPHHLIESFKSTLEEILDAQAIIHIVDASSPFKDLQIKTTLEVLDSLGVKDIPILTVFNKCDLVKNDYFLSGYEDIFKISAKFKEGLRVIVNKLDEIVYGNCFIDTFLFPYQDSKYVNLLKTSAEVYDLTFTDEGTVIKAKVSEALHNKLEKYICKEKDSKLD